MTMQYCFSCAVGDTFNSDDNSSSLQICGRYQNVIIIYFFKIYVKKIYICGKFFENKL